FRRTATFGDRARCAGDHQQPAGDRIALRAHRRLAERAFSAELSPAFHVPIHLENNIRAMALAEQWFGEARGVEQFVCIGVRSGIGAGVVVNGRLHRGSNYPAGEIGGWPREIDTNGHDHVTTLEQVASVRSILTRLTDAMKSGAKTSMAL